MGVFTGSRKLLTSRIQIQKMKKSRSKFLKIVDEKHDFNFHWPYLWRHEYGCGPLKVIYSLYVNKAFVYIVVSKILKLYSTTIYIFKLLEYNK